MIGGEVPAARENPQEKKRGAITRRNDVTVGDREVDPVRGRGGDEDVLGAGNYVAEVCGNLRPRRDDVMRGQWLLRFTAIRCSPPPLPSAPPSNAVSIARYIYYAYLLSFIYCYSLLAREIFYLFIYFYYVLLQYILYNYSHCAIITT